MATLDALKRDPILKIYAVDFLDRRRDWLRATSDIFNRARRSIDRSYRTTIEESRTAYMAYWKAEEAIFSPTFFQFSDEIEGLSKSIDEAKAVNDQVGETLSQLFRARTGFTRYTSIDAELEASKTQLSRSEEELGKLKRAISGDEEARREIYEVVLGEKLEQLDAPYLFSVVDFLVQLLAPQPPDASANANESLALLTKQAIEIAERLEKTNIDRRFAFALREYVDVLTERSFSPIKAELFSNKIRSYLFEFKDEVPGFAIAEVSALLLSQEQVFRQFPVWRTFEADASKFPLDKT